MPPANKYMDVSSVLESVDRPSLKNLTTSEYGKPNKAYNELLESLGKFTLIKTPIIFESPIKVCMAIKITLIALFCRFTARRKL